MPTLDIFKKEPSPVNAPVLPVAPPPAGVVEIAPNSLEGILFSEGKLSASQIQELSLEHINTGKSFEQLILEKKFVAPQVVSIAKAKILGLSFVDVTTLDIPSFILDFIPEALATKYLVLPFKEEGSNLYVAMADPLDLQVIAILEKRSGMRVKTFLADTTAISAAVQQQYSKALGTEVTEAIKEVNERAVSSVDSTRLTTFEGTDISSSNLENAPVARIVGYLLEYAVRSKSSDVHIEPSEDKTRVRYRIDGVLAERLSLPRYVHDNLTSRIKILSNLKIDERRIPQDGRFKVQVGHTLVDLRVSTMPTVFGEKVVMRLLEGTGNVMPVLSLGLRGTALKRLEENLSKTVGMILVTGPTGSGKTNTLASSLAKVNTIKVNIITLEDPVEIRIPGVNQVQINPTAGLTFASGLRSILRQDPDIIMVGEIRDFETAELAIHAALTGHLVFSTLHTKSAAGALPRLYDMKVEPFLLSSTVNLVIAQRLVRTLCEHCRVEYQPTEYELKNLISTLGPLFTKKPEEIKLYKPVGCKECGANGFAGRLGIFEVMAMSPRIGQAIVAHEPEEVLQKIAEEEGMVPMIKDGYLKVLDGITTMEEVMRVAKD